MLSFRVLPRGRLKRRASFSRVGRYEAWAERQVRGEECDTPVPVMNEDQLYTFALPPAQ